MNKPLTIGDLSAAVPIVQGGMGVGISLSRLAASVANAGGIGLISAVNPAYADPGMYKDFKALNIKALAREIQTARTLSPKGIIGVNIMTALTNYDDMVTTALEEGADLIISGAGLPLNLPSFLKPHHKTKLVPVISSARALSLLLRRWLDKYNYIPSAVVVEGPQSGGHQGVKRDQIDDPSHQLEAQFLEIRQTVMEFETNLGCRIPLIAAGGLTTGADILRLMELGAAGVQIGTPFIGTEECDAPNELKQMYLDCKSPEDIVILDSPVGMPVRVIKTPFVESIIRGEQTPKGCPIHCLHPCDYTKVKFCIAKALINAARGKVALGLFLTSAYTLMMDKLTTVPALFARWRDEFLLALAAKA